MRTAGSKAQMLPFAGNRWVGCMWGWCRELKLERWDGRWVEAGLGSILNGLHPDELGNTQNHVKQRRDTVGTVRKMPLAARKDMNWKGTAGGLSRRQEEAVAIEKRKERINLKAATRSGMTKMQIGGQRAAFVTYSFSIYTHFVKLRSDQR